MLNPGQTITYNKFFFIIIFLMMFLLTANTLLKIPLDKVVISVFAIVALVSTLKSVIVNRNNFILFSSFTFVIIASFLTNINTFSFQILLPLIGVIFSLQLSKSSFLFKSIYYGSFIHILIGGVLAMSSYISGPNDYVSNLAYKGVPFLNSAMGFTPTPQTYGTLCLSWLVMYFFVRDYGKVSKIDNILYIVATICLFMAINRTSFLGYLMIIFFKQRKLFVFFLSVFILLSIIYWEMLYKTLFNVSTLNSRDELLEGFNISFWGSNSYLIYLFGKGDNKLSETITRGVTWDFRNDIENGFAMILHMFGFAGLIFYITSTLIFLKKLLKANYIYECVLFIFFVFVSPYITQEFVATTFYLVLGIMLYIYNYKINAETKII